jgi:outer membrane lipoprotein-sorting protein
LIASLTPACSTQNLPRRLAAIALLAACLPVLTGCASLFTSKRKLPVPIAPAVVQTASADELVTKLNDQWAKFESLTATVDILASHLKAKEGVATDYPSFRANLLLRKPNSIRILGKAPLVQTPMFDLGSDGTRFTLVVPPKSKAYEGLNASKGTSPNWYENLRPDPLFNAMVVRGLEKDEFFSVISESITEEDTANKRLLLRPEYVLNIVRRKPDSQEQFPVRVVHFRREDLLPYEQDLYDDKGSLETQVLYGPYQDFGGTKYPGKITLKRPQDEYQLVMTVERVTANPTLTDDQFQVKVPPEYAIVELK